MINTPINKTILDTGLAIVSEELHISPSFVLSITIKAGAANSNTDKQGIAHYLEHLVFRRSANKNTKAIAEKFESLGAYINAFTTHESTMFYVRAMNENFEPIFALLCELLSQVEFDKKSMNKERSVILEEIYSCEDEAEEFFFDEADIIMFQNHPFANRILGDKKSIKKISIEDIKDFYDKYYCANSAIIAYAGNASHEKIIELSEKYMDLPIGKDINFALPELQIEEYEEMSKLSMSIKQSHLLLGRLFSIKDRKLASLTSLIIADGMSSRLYQEIREKHSLVYSVYTAIQQYSTCGLYYIYLAFSPKNTKSVFDKLQKQFKKLKEKGITEEEYTRALEMVKTGYAMEMEDISSRATRLSKYILFDREVKTITEEINVYRAISFEELNSFVKNTFNYENWHKIILEATK